MLSILKLDEKSYNQSEANLIFWVLIFIFVVYIIFILTLDDLSTYMPRI